VILLQSISILRIAVSVAALTPEPESRISPTLMPEQDQCDEDELMGSGLASPVPSTVSSADDSDNDMDEHDSRFVPAYDVKLMTASSKIEEAYADIENTVRNWYP
jgi:hypothetical protein